MEQAASFYEALALEKLGQQDRAKAIFNQLIDAGAKALESVTAAASPQSATAPAARTQVADAHYIVGLGELGLNNREKARKEFSLALEASPDHYASEQALHETMP